jgi:hypothetical protein
MFGPLSSEPWNLGLWNDFFILCDLMPGHDNIDEVK